MATTVTLKPNAIDISGSTSGTTTLQATAVAGTTTITLPAATDTLVGKATTDTLTNKTLTTPVISTISNTGTLTLPTSTDTLVGRATTDTLTNKTLTSPTLTTPALGTPASGVMTNVTGINYDGFKNRIINGAMVIDQRNAGASVTLTTDGTYTLDRWDFNITQASKLTSQQTTTTVPTGFSHSLKITSSSAYSVISTDSFVVQQRIEGSNVADLSWGTANAKTITVSFWVYSSLTGTFNISLSNGAFNRSYPVTYTISSANTWEQKTITIAGDTSGTWVNTNTSSAGLVLFFNLGSGSTMNGTNATWASGWLTSVSGSTSLVGTNGATFYITGVQLEKGSTATSFDYRPYGTEFVLCQRYYQQTNTFTAVGVSANTNIYAYISFPVTMRSSPSVGQTAVLQISDGVTNDWTQSATGISINSSRVSIYGITFTGDNFASVTAYRPYFAKQNTTGLVTLNSEL